MLKITSVTSASVRRSTFSSVTLWTSSQNCPSSKHTLSKRSMSFWGGDPVSIVVSTFLTYGAVVGAVSVLTPIVIYKVGKETYNLSYRKKRQQQQFLEQLTTTNKTPKQVIEDKLTQIKDTTTSMSISTEEIAELYTVLDNWESKVKKIHHSELKRD